jgi:hypothetical protein
MIEEGEGTYQFHLVLDTEQFLLRLHAGVGAIGELGNELVARNEVRILFRQLVDESALDVVLGEREVGLHVGILAKDVGLGGGLLAGDDDGDLATMTRASVAGQLR